MFTLLTIAAWLIGKVAFVAILALLAFRLRGGSELRTNAWQPLTREGEFEAVYGSHAQTMRAAA